ncbi:hypothetical protein DRO61_07470 [Candidatus Bathyarchaeota archaeon]|nr:MAG: hypothetical protein DRO61_07470 [Candidatus Bathyarchaeota archaeon]
MGLKKFTTAEREKIELPPKAISINIHGKIVFNKSVELSYDFENSLKYAVIWFDDVKNVISISFAKNEEDDGAMKVLHSESVGYYINAKSFLTWAKIPFERTSTFPMTEKNNCFVFTVKKSQLKNKTK